MTESDQSNQSSPPFIIPEASGQSGVQGLPHEVSFAYLSSDLADEMGIDHPPGNGVYVNPLDMRQIFFHGEDENPPYKDSVIIEEVDPNKYGIVLNQRHLRAAFNHSLEQESRGNMYRDRRSKVLGTMAGLVVAEFVSGSLAWKIMDSPIDQSSALSNVAKGIASVLLLIAPFGVALRMSRNDNSEKLES